VILAYNGFNHYYSTEDNEDRWSATISKTKLVKRYGISSTTVLHLIYVSEEFLFNSILSSPQVYNNDFIQYWPERIFPCELYDFFAKYDGDSGCRTTIKKTKVPSKGNQDLHTVWSKKSEQRFYFESHLPCGKLCLTFGPNFGGLGTKRKVRRKKKG
jgi:hypothetical protein